MKYNDTKVKALSANNLLEIICPNVLFKPDFINKFVTGLSVSDDEISSPTEYVKPKNMVRTFKFVSDAKSGVGSVKMNVVGKAETGTYAKKHHVHVYTLPDIDNKSYIDNVVLYLLNALVLPNAFIDNGALPLVISYADKLYYMKMDLAAQKFIHAFKSVIHNHVVDTEKSQTKTAASKFDTLIEDNFDSIVERFGEEKIKSWIVANDEKKISALLKNSNIKFKSSKITEYE